MCRDATESPSILSPSPLIFLKSHHTGHASAIREKAMRSTYPGGPTGPYPGGPPGMHFKSVEEALKMNPFLTTLKKALNATGLIEPLNDPELVATILAPSDSAFQQLLIDLSLTEEELFEDTQLLSQVLTYHVIPGSALKAADIDDGLKAETLLEDQSVTFEVQSFFFFTKVEVIDAKGGRAMVVFPDVGAAKSIIHVLDKVLIPDVPGLRK